MNLDGLIFNSSSSSRGLQSLGPANWIVGSYNKIRLHHVETRIRSPHGYLSSYSCILNGMMRWFSAYVTTGYNEAAMSSWLLSPILGRWNGEILLPQWPPSFPTCTPFVDENATRDIQQIGRLTVTSIMFWKCLSQNYSRNFESRDNLRLLKVFAEYQKKKNWSPDVPRLRKFLEELEINIPENIRCTRSVSILPVYPCDALQNNGGTKLETGWSLGDRSPPFI